MFLLCEGQEEELLPWWLLMGIPVKNIEGQRLRMLCLQFLRFSIHQSRKAARKLSLVLK